MKECNCKPCQVARRHESEGVPKEVCQAYGLVISTRESNLTEDTFAERLDAELTNWTYLKNASVEMIDKGILTDDDFGQVVASGDLIAAANLYTRIKDYAASKAN